MSLTPRTWAGTGQRYHGPVGTSEPVVGSTDETAATRCYTKRTLTDYLGISTRSWDRAAAMGLTPAPDLVVGRSPRWSPDTISKWLRTHPRLPGRKGANHDAS